MSVKDKAAAIDRFVRTIKASGVYDDIGTACIMAGWTNLAGALYPLKGAAPTNNGFLAADLDAGIGLKGDGSSKYLNSNQANNAMPQDSIHVAGFISSASSASSAVFFTSYGGTPTGLFVSAGNDFEFYLNSLRLSTGISAATGFFGASRSAATTSVQRVSAADTASSVVSGTRKTDSIRVFNDATESATYASDATLSWYSIGTATDLAALDSAVSTLMADLRAIDEAGFDRDALAYIRNVEAADGSYLETGVKQAINAFVVGCKKDGIWDAIKASCILCGARTISGALVPLAGTAPTAYNFVSGNYNRSTGLVGVPASGTYINTNRLLSADPQDDYHCSVYEQTVSSSPNAMTLLGGGGAGNGAVTLQHTTSAAYTRVRSATLKTGTGVGNVAGFIGASRGNSAGYTQRYGGVDTPQVDASSEVGDYITTVFARGTTGGGRDSLSDARLAFYSIGSAIPDLAALDTRVSTLVASIAAAI